MVITIEDIPSKLTCQKCGKTLGKIPAETYAGTYTGLCYDCQNSSSYVIEKFSDGAMTISYPPSCPSHRRDRGHHTAYADCPKCGGTGRKYVSRCMSMGGPYYEYCPDCLNKFCKNNQEEYISSEVLGYPHKCYRINNRIWAITEDRDKLRYCL